MKDGKTGLMYSDIFGNYEAGKGYLCIPAAYNDLIETDDYYDTPERVSQAYNLMKKTGLLDKLTIIEPRMATRDELLGFHTEEYIDKLQKLSSQEGGLAGPYCQIGKDGFEVVSSAVGGDFKALDSIMDGEIKNAFCLQRPPAAHAERNNGLGFCVVNAFNLLIKRAREKYGLKRIMIIDFDNHYKYGIEQAWFGTDEVLYAETHQSGAYGENSACDRNADNIGEGKGKGYNVVIPLPSGSGDEAYVKAFEEIIKPIADQYKPELIVVIAGFAANIFDPLCRQQLTATGYGKLMKIIAEIAEENCDGRMIAILEGGKGNYMSFCIHKVIEEMSGEKCDLDDFALHEGFIERNHLTAEQNASIENVKKILAPYWKL